MKVIFSHGKESGPWGSKIKRLSECARARGFTVDSIDYTDLQDPDLRVERLLEYCAEMSESVILAGSSMGGYVSLVAAEELSPKGVFLLAPALYMPGYQRQAYVGHQYLEIVHGWADDVIPPEHSIRFAQEAQCTLHLISGDHRLNTSLEQVERLFEQFLMSLD